MDDIESSNPSWDDDYHMYASGLDNLFRLNGNDPPDGVCVDPDADQNEWGRIGFRHTRHSFSGIPSNGQMRLGCKPCCGLLESNYCSPLRFAPLELEFTTVSDSNEPFVAPQGAGATQTDANGYYFQAGNTSVFLGN